LWNEVGFDETDLLWEESIYAETEERTFKTQNQAKQCCQLAENSVKNLKGACKKRNGWQTPLRPDLKPLGQLIMHNFFHKRSIQ
jgi:hypothetical protein